MSQPGEIPVEEASAVKPEGGDEAEAVVVAAAVVDEDVDDGSTGSGSVVVAKIVDDEEPPTPNTAKIEADLAKKIPAAVAPTVVPPAEKPAVDDSDKEEGEIDTPIKKNVETTEEKDKAGDAQDIVDVKMEAQPAEETAETKDAEPEPTKIPKEDEVSSTMDVIADKEVVKEEDAEKQKEVTDTEPPKTAEKEATGEAASTTKDNEVKTEVPMDVEPTLPVPETKEEDNDAEDGEVVEEGEVEEGQVEAVSASIEEEKTSVGPPQAKERDEGQTKEDTKEETETKHSITETIVPEEEPEKKEEMKEDVPEAMDVDNEEKKPEESPKEAPKEAAVADVPAEGAKNAPTADDKVADEDGEIKEGTDEEGEIKEDTEEEGEVKDDTEEEVEVKVEAPVVEKEPPIAVAEKEDVEMEDTLSQTEDSGDNRDSGEIAADTASNDGDTASLADESTTRKVEPTYSTRGRASGSTTPVPRGSDSTAKGSNTGSTQSGAKSEQWERSVREALEDLGRGNKDAPPAGVGQGTSFLEALGEEERRTRTRFLPAVDGIHMLRKNEIKSDLALARSIMSNAGAVASVNSVAAGGSGSSLSKKSKKKKNQDGEEAEAMDTDDAGLSSSEDDPSSDPGARVGSASTIEVDLGGLLKVPSTAFVPPPAATQSFPTPMSNGERKDDGSLPAPALSSGKASFNNQRNMKSPSVVESVTAFNPPRPPESVGKKKQHRMLRWERRPADVEVDLNNYRKTVDRTRKELHTAEDELERIEATSNHLRRHFLGHIQCMDQESDEILREFDSVQQRCVNAAELLTARTRTRGAGKGSHVMRDVMAVLRARGLELREKGIDLATSQSGANDSPKEYLGIGGVGGSGLADWNQDSVIKPQRIASAWILPGDKVDTPYGEGVVVQIFEDAALDVKQPRLEESAAKAASDGNSPSKMDAEAPVKSSPKSGCQKSGGSKGGKKKGVKGQSSEERGSFLGTRIAVRLPFGVGYFSPAVVATKASSSSLSDAQLAKRWSGIVESALSQAGKLDLNGMSLSETAKKLRSENQQNAEATGQGASDGGAPMDVDGATNERATTDPATDGALESVLENKLLPFASRLIPTGTGRGHELCEMNAQKLQKALKPALTEGKGVLGDPANEGVPAIIKEFEKERQESYILQAKVFHLRNQLYRQRRIRTLNERTFSATRDRSTRVEGLVAEMRTDLKSLRNRLDEELVELGIDQDRAEGILKAYYLAQDSDEQLEADLDDHKSSPAQKRTREEDHQLDGDQETNGMPDTKRAKVAAQ